MKSTNIPVGTDDSAHTDLNPVALLVIPHMMSVHSKSVLYNDGVKVACVAYLLTARADFKQLQVFLRLALPIQHLFLYVSALSKTPLHRLIQRLLFREIFFMRSRVGLVYSHSFVLALSVDCHHWNHSKHQNTTYQLTVVVSSRQIRFVQGPELQGDAQTTSLSHSVCASAAPQSQKQIAHCKPRQGTLSSRTSALMLCPHHPRHLESRTHHNLGHLMFQLPTPRFSSRGPEDN